MGHDADARAKYARSGRGCVACHLHITRSMQGSASLVVELERMLVPAAPLVGMGHTPHGDVRAPRATIGRMATRRLDS